VHRGLEPSCVHLVGAKREVRLGGFGVASLFESSPGIRDANAPQSPYLAPEQVRGEHADHHADIYALGAILWETLTGAPPSTPPDTSRIPEGTPPLLPHLLLALLAPDAGARPAALSEEARAFRELLATPEGPPPAGEPADSEPRRAVRPRHTALAVGASAIVLAVIRLFRRRARGARGRDGRRA
jgi:serine/threonine protein kinase